jgi:C-terminal processing protease CtpA/Prc
LRPGDVVTRVDGVFLNATDQPLSRALLGKAGMQVLLEVDQKPREAEDDDEQEIVAQLTQGMMMPGAMGPMGMSGAMGMMMGANAPVDGSLGGYGGGYARTRVSSGGSVWANSQGFTMPTVHHAAEAKRRANLGARAKLGSPETNNDGVSGSATSKPLSPSATSPASPAQSEKKMIGGLKNVVVTPLSHEECTQLRAADALNNRRGYVQKKSNDRLAYIYLEDMEQMGEGASNSFDDFAAQFYPAIRKAGLIIDVRRNAGGNIDTWILERLRRVAWMFNTQRAGPGDTTMQYAFRGKVAVLVDEMTSSDAEIFAAGVQELGLGKVVGARTWGGAVGYSSNPELALVDGSGFTIPSFGPYVGGRWMIEQRGVVPDIAVANDPVATFNGKDAQLDAAVAHLMEMIEAEPLAEAIPKKPQYPDWSFDREVCRAGGDGGGKAREQRKGVLA